MVLHDMIVISLNPALLSSAIETATRCRGTNGLRSLASLRVRLVRTSSTLVMSVSPTLITSHSKDELTVTRYLENRNFCLFCWTAVFKNWFASGARLAQARSTPGRRVIVMDGWASCQVRSAYEACWAFAVRQCDANDGAVSSTCTAVLDCFLVAMARTDRAVQHNRFLASL